MPRTPAHDVEPLRKLIAHLTACKRRGVPFARAWAFGPGSNGEHPAWDGVHPHEVQQWRQVWFEELDQIRDAYENRGVRPRWTERLHDAGLVAPPLAA